MRCRDAQSAKVLMSPAASPHMHALEADWKKYLDPRAWWGLLEKDSVSE